MSDSHVDVRKHVKLYIGVFGALAVLTVLTVAASTVDFGGSTNVVIALVIATCKASLVAAIFMHLKWEKTRAIWWTLALCAVFFAVLMVVPLVTLQDLPPGVKLGSWG